MRRNPPLREGGRRGGWNAKYITLRLAQQVAGDCPEKNIPRAKVTVGVEHEQQYRIFIAQRQMLGRCVICFPRPRAVERGRCERRFLLPKPGVADSSLA